MLLAQSKRLISDAANGDTVREYTDVIQRYWFASGQGVAHGCGIFRLDADDSNIRLLHFDAGGDAGDQAATADGNEYSVDFAVGLFQQFATDCALAGDNQLDRQRDV